MHFFLLQAQVAAPSSQEQGVAYVTRPGGPPDTGGYMSLGYGVTAAIYVGYVLLISRRIARARRAR